MCPPTGLRERITGSNGARKDFARMIYIDIQCLNWPKEVAGELGDYDIVIE